MPCPARRGCLPLGTKSEGVDIISRVTAHSGDQVGRHPLRHEARFGHKLAVEEEGASGRAHRHAGHRLDAAGRSEEHTSELQSLMRISYDVFCLKTKKRP